MEGEREGGGEKLNFPSISGTAGEEEETEKFEPAFAIVIP